MQFPLPLFRFLAVCACLPGCGSADTGASPDASKGDGARGDAQPPPAAEGASAEAAPGDALENTVDADTCKGVRCAAPPPCDQPCTTTCCCDRSCPPLEAGVDGEPPGRDAASTDAGGACTGAGDCRLFSDMCGACTCVALGAGAPNPVCQGSQVACFRDPCGGQSAACIAGHCAAQ